MMLLQIRNTSQSSNDDQSWIGRLWLQSARTARKSGYYQSAYSALLQAAVHDRHLAHIEKGKLLWHQNKIQSAIAQMMTYLKNFEPVNKRLQERNTTSIKSKGDRDLQAKVI